MNHSATLTIRPESVQDHPLTEALALAAFAPDERVARLVHQLRLSEALIGELNLVAEVAGQLVGHLMVSRASISSGHTVRPVIPLGRLALPSARAGGLRRSNLPVLVLEGVPAYYPRFGFTSAHAMGIEPPFALPTEVWQALRLPAYQATVRGVVHYPAPFAFLHPPEPPAE